MEDSWTFDDHRMQLFLQTLLGHIMQRPVPIVVIVKTEMLRTLSYGRPSAAIESETHIVLAAYPGHHFDLHVERKIKNSPHYYSKHLFYRLNGTFYGYRPIES